MSSVPARTTSSSITSLSSTLQRGQACLNCRRRKIRCDGGRPVCGQCSRASRPRGNCEYTDPGRTRNQVLEDTIAQLEARIQELESSELVGASAVAPSLHGSDASQEQLSESDVPLMPPPRVGVVGGHAEEPSVQDRLTLIDSFLPYAFEFGFFLNTARFRQSLLASQPIGDHSRPSPALLQTVYLVGASLTRLPGLSSSESTVLANSLKDTAVSLSSSHPNRILHGIQADILLSYYFFRVGRFLEGRLHASTAWTTALHYGLHRIGSSPFIQEGDTAESYESVLDPPVDPTEESERIKAFWAVYTLHNFWIVVTEPPYGSSSDIQTSQIHTPWPVDNDDDHILTAFHNNSPIQDFLSHRSTLQPGEHSVTTMYTKAIILFERSSQLAYQDRSGASQQSQEMFVLNYTMLDALADNLKAELRSLDQYRGTQPFMSMLGVAHALVHAAVIRLYCSFSRADRNLREKCVTAASHIIELSDNDVFRRLTYMHPIMRVLWSIACRVLIDEIAQLRMLRSVWMSRNPDEKEEKLIRTLTQGFEVMSRFAERSPFIGQELAQLRAVYASTS